MTRAQIRQAIDEALASKGYSRGWYSWQGCWLSIISQGGRERTYHSKFPSGISRKRFIEAIKAIETIGQPKHLPIHEKADRMRQIDIEEFLGEGRR